MTNKDYSNNHITSFKLASVNSIINTKKIPFRKTLAKKTVIEIDLFLILFTVKNKPFVLKNIPNTNNKKEKTLIIIFSFSLNNISEL